MKNKLSVLGGAVLVAGGAIKLAKPMRKLVLGNRPKFSPARTSLNPQSSLYGKKIIFLGSSITYGAAALGKSFVDYLEAEDGIVANKLAISGTTLAGNESNSYISRLLAFMPKDKPDVFVCQLSTNDGRQGKSLGVIAPDKNTAFDTETTIGAMEAIIAHVQSNWNCPIIFYTCLRKPDEDYEQLVHALYQLQTKWGFDVIDLLHDKVVETANKQRPNAMFDDAHPTQLGYRNIWTPIFRLKLAQILN